MIGTTPERRERNRLPARPIEPAGPGAAGPYRLLDISRSGCLLQSREPLGEAGTVLRLNLPLPKREERNSVTARIVWKTHQAAGDEGASWLYGLHFEEMDAESRKTLSLYLDFLRRDCHLTGLDEAWRKLRTSGRG